MNKPIRWRDMIANEIDGNYLEDSDCIEQQNQGDNNDNG